MFFGGFFFENLGFFKIKEVFLKFFGVGFEDLILKTSYIASHEHYNSIVMHLDVCNWLCAGRFGLGWAHDAISFACHIFMHSHEYVPSFQYILIYLNYLGLFWLSFSSSLSLLFMLVHQWHQNISLLCPKTLFISRHLCFLILPPLLFNSVMRMLERTSRRTSLDEAFIQNNESSSQTSSTLTYPLSFTVGVGSHYVTSRSPLLPCWSRSSTPTCMD